MFGNIALIALMILISACFSASETSFNASNKMRLKKAAEAGSKSAALAYKMSGDFTSALSTILIGNNLANTAASTAATVFTMKLLFSFTSVTNDALASLISTSVMTVIILIFGEIIPKIISRDYADILVRFFAYPTRILTWFFYPLVWLVIRIVSLLSRVWGKDDDEAPTITEQELSSIIDTVEEEGVIDEDKGELLQSALEFRGTTVEEIMTPRVDITGFDIEDDQAEISQMLDTSRYSRIPVYDNSIDNIIGVLFLNRYYKFMTEKFTKTRTTDGAPDIRALLMKPCFLHKTMRLPAALSIMRERKTHLAIVTDEYGGTLGIVTMEDILEELVGEIWDESDEIITAFRQVGENTYEVSGDMNIDDFFAEIEFEPYEFECDYSTMGGWAIEMLNAEPHVGDTFVYPVVTQDYDEDDEQVRLIIAISEMADMRVTRLTVLVSSVNDQNNISDE